MRKYVELPDGACVELEGEESADSWDVSTWECNGVVERSARRSMEWREIYEFPPEHWQRIKDSEEFTPEELEEKRLANLKRAARRAKTMCRRVIITEGFDELLTLTYRENQQDRALCKKHFAQWCRRMRKAIPGFRFCASFERQERGAMHVHLATNRLPAHAVFKGVKVKAFDLGTRIWRSVVGDNNGLCHVGGHTKFGGRRRSLSLAKMAAYVSKYILKDFEDCPEDVSRYSRSHGTVIATPERVTFHGLSAAEAIALVYEYLPYSVVHSLRYNRFGSIWFCSEKSTKGPS